MGCISVFDRISITDHGWRPSKDNGVGRLVPVLGIMILFPEAALPDTVVLKTGGTIKECRIQSEADGTVYLRTPGGTMGVPRSVIVRIEKARSLFDAFEEKRARLAPGDGSGTFNLALWCRDAAGLREEMDDLLQKTLLLQPENLQARKLLGYYRSGQGWKQLPPLPLSLKVTATRAPMAAAAAAAAAAAKKKSAGGKEGPPAPVRPRSDELREEIENQLNIILHTRRDVELDPGAPREGPGAGVELAIQVLEGRSPSPIYFGQAIGGPTSHATLTISAAASWMTTRPPELRLLGEVPGSLAPESNLALLDAMARGTKQIHEYLDRLNGLRVDRWAAAAAPPAPEGKSRHGKNPGEAGPCSF
jgi:hypothetical protein